VYDAVMDREKYLDDALAKIESNFGPRKKWTIAEKINLGWLCSTCEKARCGCNCGCKRCWGRG